MNQIVNNIMHAFDNAHVRWPVIIGVAIGGAQIFLPQYAGKLDALAALLGGYGLLALGNTPSDASQTANSKATIGSTTQDKTKV